MLVGRLAHVAGADGCKEGWIAVTADPEALDKAEVKIFKNFAELISELPARSIIAIDMPIGLAEYTDRGGREPDWAARKFLGRQRASVFPVPSRRAVYERDYAAVCAMARETSEPRRAVSKQLFGILPRIQQIDEILLQDPALRKRVFEVHPEVSFKVMYNNRPLPQRKKVKGRINEPGMQLRKELLTKEGFHLAFLDQKPPHGPSHPPLDGEGLEQAIRA